MKLLLTHTPRMREQYYSPRALTTLRDLAQVTLHEGDGPLDADALIAAAEVDLVVSDRLTPGPGEAFARLPRLRAFLRCAVDIRTIDGLAASRAGVLVTHAAPGFVASVTELALGVMVYLARGLSRATRAYQAGRALERRMGRQLAGSRLGIIGYGGTSGRSPAISEWRC